MHKRQHGGLNPRSPSISLCICTNSRIDRFWIDLESHLSQFQGRSCTASLPAASNSLVIATLPLAISNGVYPPHLAAFITSLVCACVIARLGFALEESNKQSAPVSIILSADVSGEISGLPNSLGSQFPSSRVSSTHGAALVSLPNTGS